MTSVEDDATLASKAARAIETVEELVAHIDLVGVRTYEVSGKRAEPVEVDARPTEANMSIQVLENHGPEQIETRFRATVEGRDGDFAVDLGVLYRFDEPLELSRDAIEGLLERVAIMAAWPFIREAVATTAARMELEVPLLGLMKQGAFTVDRVDA